MLMMSIRAAWAIASVPARQAPTMSRIHGLVCSVVMCVSHQSAVQGLVGSFGTGHALLGDVPVGVALNHAERQPFEADLTALAALSA